MDSKRQVLFIQGGGKGVHDGWDDKLVDSLRRELGDGYDVRYPRMPHEDDPSFERWKPTLERECDELGADAIVVGHSIGATILLRWLVERFSTGSFGGIVAIAAPFVGEGGWSDQEFEFSSDLGARLPHGVPIHFFHGTKDAEVPTKHVDLFARAVPQAHAHRVAGRDHQFNNDLKDVAQEILALE